MISYVFVKPNGEAAYTASVAETTSYEAGTLYNGLLCLISPDIEAGQLLERYFWDFSSSTWEIKPAKPGAFYVFNYSTKQWVDPRTLEELKEARRAEIKQARTKAEYAGFVWDGSVFDSDVVSQGRITGAVTLALIALQAQQPYEVTWTLADGSFRILSAQDLLSVGAALGTHVQTNFNKGQALQVQIDAATTKEELDLITW